MDTLDAKTLVAGSLNFLTSKYTCHIFGYVIMPNHLHAILYFPEKNYLSDLMRDFKKFTSVKLRHQLEATGEIHVEALRHEIRDQKFKVWMDRFDDVCILNAETLRVKLDYIHNNPLQEHWQLASKPEDYGFSSAAYYEANIAGPVNITNFIDFVW